MAPDAPPPEMASSRPRVLRRPRSGDLAARRAVRPARRLDHRLYALRRPIPLSRELSRTGARAVSRRPPRSPRLSSLAARRGRATSGFSDGTCRIRTFSRFHTGRPPGPARPDPGRRGRARPIPTRTAAARLTPWWATSTSAATASLLVFASSARRRRLLSWLRAARRTGSPGTTRRGPTTSPELPRRPKLVAAGRAGDRSRSPPSTTTPRSTTPSRATCSLPSSSTATAALPGLVAHPARQPRATHAASARADYLLSWSAATASSARPNRTAAPLPHADAPSHGRDDGVARWCALYFLCLPV